MVVLVALVVVGLVGTTTFILLDRNADDNPPPPDAGDPTAEIIALQEDFKRYVENQLDMIDLLPAVKAYTKDYPDQDAGHILLAQVLMKMELYSEAYPALDRALAGNADNFELRKLTGTCAAKLGLWDEAEEHLLVADALKKDETVVLQLANMYFQTGRLDQAEEAYELAKRMSGMTSPHKANAGLAEVYAARGDYETALKKIALAIKWAQGDSEAELWVYQLSMVRMLFDDGQWERGGALLNTTRSGNPDVMLTLPFARLGAREKAQQGDFEGAISELALIASPAVAPPGQTDRERADILAEYAYWCLEAGDADQASVPLEALRALMPGHPRLAELEARATAPE